MATKPSDANNPKVMDVARPGKGKIMVNSRPIASPVVADSAESGDVKLQQTDTAESEPLLAPSAAKRVIQPINVSSDDTDDEIPVTLGQPSGDTEATSPEEPEPDQAASDEPESSDSLPTPKADGSAIAPEAPATDASGAASVDELAKAAEAKRLSAEKSKEDAERDQRVQELIKSRQYNVPIKHAHHGHAKLKITAVLTVIILALAGYLLVDVGVFGSGVKLPFEVFKEESAAKTPELTAGAIADGTEVSRQISPAVNAAEDEERKAELKNLQQKLVAYFSDNESYPETLDGLKPTATEDELTDSTGVAYEYETDGQTYTLTASLSDGTAHQLKSAE